MRKVRKGFQKYHAKSRAQKRELLAAEKVLKTLPADYKAFLVEVGAGSGPVGTSHLNLWRADELIENNAGYGLGEYASGLVLIGSNGGGEAFGFDTRRTPPSVVMVPFVSSGWEDALTIASSFEAFLDRLGAGDDLFDSPQAEP